MLWIPLSRVNAGACSCLGRSHIFSNAIREASTVSRSKVKLDEAIPHSVIHLVCPTTKSLLPPASLKSLLASLDRSRFAIRLVDESRSPPVCTVYDKKAEYERQRTRRKNPPSEDSGSLTSTSSSSKAGDVKEIRISWTTSQHDLNHKLARARAFLQKGQRVRAVFGVSRNSTSIDSQAKLNQKAKDDLVKQTVQALNDCGKLCRNQGAVVAQGEIAVMLERA